MKRRGVFLLLAAAVIAAVVLLGWRESRDDEEPVAGREAGPGDESPDARTEETGPVLQGTARAGAVHTGVAARKPSLFGRVVDEATGAGIAGARLAASAYLPGTGKTFRLAWTDAEGRYGIHDLAPGTWWLFAWHPAYIPAGLTQLFEGATWDPPPDVMQIVVPKGAVTLPRRELALKAGRQIVGRVVDASNAPVAGATIRLHASPWRQRLALRVPFSLYDYQKYIPLTSDDEGRFAMAFLPASMGPVRIGAATKDAVSRWSEEIPLDRRGEPQEIVLKVVTTATVSGHVRRADGTPASSAEVGLAWSQESELESAWAITGVDGAEVDARGAYELTGLPPGPLELQVDWWDPYLEGPERGLEPLAPGEVRTGIDFVMPERYVVRGRLVNAAGDGLSREFVLVKESDDSDDTRTEEDGSFALAFPRPGPVEILHMRPAGEDEVLRGDLRLPAEDLVLVSEATPRTKLEVRAKDPEGTVVPVFTSSVECKGGRSRYQFDSDEKGKGGAAAHVVYGEAPFRVEVDGAEDADGRPLPLGSVRRTVETQPANGVVEVALPYEDAVFGRIVGPDGQAVPGVVLTLVDTRGETKRRVRIPIEPDGHFSLRIGKPPPSPVGSALVFLSVEVTVPLGYTAVRPVQPYPGQIMRTIVLRPGGTISGRVIAPGRLPAQVRVYWEEGSVTVPVDEKGRWQAERVPLGLDLTAHVWAEDAWAVGYRVPKSVEGLRAGARDVEIRLVAGLSVSGTCLEADGTLSKEEVVIAARPVDDPENGPWGWAEISKADGGFTVPGLAPGAYRLVVLAPGTGSRIDGGVAQAGADDVAIRLPPRASITIRVVCEEMDEDEDLESYDVDAWVAGTTRQAVVQSFEDSPPLVLSGLPTGQAYDLVVSTYSGYAGAAGGVRTGDEVTITLVETETLRGVVTRADGSEKPFPGDLYALREGACFHLGLAKDGRFKSYMGIAPGRYEIRFVHLDGTETTLARDVKAGREDLELVLR